MSSEKASEAHRQKPRRAFCSESIRLFRTAGLSLTGNRVVAVLERLREQGHLPRLRHVDNDPEFTRKALDSRAYERGVRIEFNRPDKPTDKAHVDSFNGRFRDECLDANLFSSIADARRQVEA